MMAMVECVKRIASLQQQCNVSSDVRRAYTRYPLLRASRDTTRADHISTFQAQPPFVEVSIASHELARLVRQGQCRRLLRLRFCQAI